MLDPNLLLLARQINDTAVFINGVATTLEVVCQYLDQDGKFTEFFEELTANPNQEELPLDGDAA
jgi:hypothetical protein